MTDIALWYFVQGKEDVSKIIISKNKLVVDLIKAIHDQSSIHFKDVIATELVLVKVNIDLTQYPGAVRDLVPEIATKINSTSQIGQLWPDAPTPFCLSICVRPPEVSRKRRKVDTEEPEDYISGPLATKAPSAVAMHSEVQKMQSKQERRVANDRPYLDTNHLPIALLYKGFGHFLDVAAGASTDPALDINQRQFELNVDRFMMSMNAYYPTEDERNDEALNFLNKIFQCCLGEHTQKLLPGILHKGRCSDGHALGPADTIEVVLEVKNELGSGHADPTIELTAYCMQSLKCLTTNVRSRFFFPALGIVVVGSHIDFYALAYPNFSARLVALTPLLPTMAESGNNWVRPALLNAFRAACVLRHHIYEDTKASAEVSITQMAPFSQLPYVDQVAAYSTPGIIRFHIQVEAYQGEPRYQNRFIYLATLDGTEVTVVVKFTRQYFPQLHYFCASQGHAPQLLGYGDIPGGWHIVVMEWINHEDTNLKYFAPEHLHRWSKDLKSTVKAFHHKGWVHGDHRVANLIVGNQEPERVLLVDFDWGGDTTTGPVYFPATLVNKELIPGHLGSSQITKEHDDHVLASTLEKLAGSENSL